MRKIIIAILSVGVLAFGLIYYINNKESKKMISNNNLSEISEQDVENFQILLKEAVANAGIVVSEEKVVAEINRLKEEFGGEESFLQILSDEGLTDEGLLEEIRFTLAVQVYLEQELKLSEIVATEIEVAAAYAEVLGGQEGPELSEVYSIVEKMVIEQKQQEIILQHLFELESKSDDYLVE
jgi:hypothetical protein